LRPQESEQPFLFRIGPQEGLLRWREIVSVATINALREVRLSGHASSVDRNSVEKFFARERFDFVLITRIAVGLIAYFVADGAMATIDGPFWLAFFSIVGDSLAVIAVLKILNLITVACDRITQGHRRQLLRAKRSIAAKLMVIAFEKSGFEMTELIGFDVGKIFLEETESAPLWSDALMADLDSANMLSENSAIFFAQRKIDAKLRFVPAGRDIYAEYSPLTVFVLYLSEEKLFVYCADVDLVVGEIRNEEIDLIFLKHIVDISASQVTRRLKRYTGGETFEKYRREARYEVGEIVCCEHSIRISKIDGGNVDLVVGTPQYRPSARGILYRDDWIGDRRRAMSEAIVLRINDIRSRCKK
jgi:hypothetical protein